MIYQKILRGNAFEQIHFRVKKTLGVERQFEENVMALLHAYKIRKSVLKTQMNQENKTGSYVYPKIPRY